MSNEFQERLKTWKQNREKVTSIFHENTLSYELIQTKLSSPPQWPQLQTPLGFIFSEHVSRGITSIWDDKLPFKLYQTSSQEPKTLQTFLVKTASSLKFIVANFVVVANFLQIWNQCKHTHIQVKKVSIMQRELQQNGNNDVADNDNGFSFFMGT